MPNSSEKKIHTFCQVPCVKVVSDLLPVVFHVGFHANMSISG